MPELIQSSYDPSLKKTLDNTISKINDYRSDTPFVDDIVLLGFEV